jgi:hypothetical protein
MGGRSLYMGIRPLKGRGSHTSVFLTTDSLRSAKLRRSLAHQINHPLLVNGRNNRNGDALRATMATRRFPPPWSVEELLTCFVVCDHNGQKLACVYFEDEPGRRGESAHARRGTANSSQHGKAAGAFAEAVIRSVELIVQPDAHDVVGSGEAINGPAAISGRSALPGIYRHPRGRSKSTLSSTCGIAYAPLFHRLINP